MTEITFHFNVPEKLGYACRVLRKVAGLGARVVVTGEQPLLQSLDAQLWTFSETDFVAHCLAGAEAHVLAASPVVLCGTAAGAPHHQVLVNLGAAVPEGFERFEKLIEMVGQDEGDRQLGRVRWKHYADRGYAIGKHEFGSREGS